MDRELSAVSCQLSAGVGLTPLSADSCELKAKSYLHQEERALDHGIELPDVLVVAAEKIDGDFVMRLDLDLLPTLGDDEVVLGDGQLEIFRLRQDIPLDFP